VAPKGGTGQAHLRVRIKVELGGREKGVVTKYVGSFQDGARHGFGEIQREGEWLVKGEFDRGHIKETSDLWLRMRSPKSDALTCYYGELNQRGERSGYGRLFAASGGDDAFRRDVESGGTSPSGEAPPSLLYAGKWANDLPNGEGIQYFQGLGTYTGQFQQGLRHGRGEWVTSTAEGIWKFGPADGPNWNRDIMHGFMTVESPVKVQKNVVFDKGVSLMPIELQKSLFETVTAPQPLPSATMGFVGGIGPAARSCCVTLPQWEVAEPQSLDLALGASVDEPILTDLVIPEEDVRVLGGTGDNSVMNGVFFRIWGAPSVYKHVSSEGEARYLYRSVETTAWMISHEPMGAERVLRRQGCALVDDVAEHPMLIRSGWQVWHPVHRQLMACGEGGIPGAKGVAPADTLEVRGLMGFKMTGPLKGESGLKPDLMRRLPGELCGRPAYVSDNGQYLFWVDAATKGRPEGDLDTAAETLWDDIELPRSGSWVVASVLGEKPEGASSRAYATDPAITPDQIPVQAVWRVRSARGHFWRQAGLRVEATEWQGSSGDDESVTAGAIQEATRSSGRSARSIRRDMAPEDP